MNLINKGRLSLAIEKLKEAKDITDAIDIRAGDNIRELIVSALNQLRKLE